MYWAEHKNIKELKAALRHKAYEARNGQVEKDRFSQQICQNFVNSDAYRQAETVMWYIHCRSEVRTASVLAQVLAGDKRVVIPFCTRNGQGDNVLGLWQLQDLSELVSGTWNIMEPPRDRWSDKDRIVLPEELDIIMVPGVGFDRQGGRLGNGAGYYDRLLDKVRVDTVLSAVCFECQLFLEVPMEMHDIYMDYVFTELNCYSGQGRKGRKKTI